VTNERAQQIATLLITRRFLPKKELRDMFLDDDLMNSVSERLNAVGLEPATNVYSNYVSVKALKSAEEAAFKIDENRWSASSHGMSRGALALLAIVWAKIILPKRQMQIERRSPEDEGQVHIWQDSRTIPKDDSMVELNEKALLADFGEKLGGKTKFATYLNELARLDFIVKKSGKITEGPLLDTVVDYSILSRRIIDGALAALLGIGENDDGISDNQGGKDA
jgi:hypothetical protein